MWKKIISASVLTLVFISCKKNAGPEGPQGAQGPTSPNGNGTGIILGNVRQFDEYKPAVQYTNSLNNVTVSIDGTTLTTVTDSLGNYKFSNMALGVYDISYIRMGAGLNKKRVICPGAGTLYISQDSLYDKPTLTYISGSLTDTLQTQHELYLKLNYTLINKIGSFIIAFGKSNAIDLGNSDSYDTLYFSTINYNTPTNRVFNYPTYPSGTVFYAKVYPISSFGYRYYDYQKNKNVYTTYGKPLPQTFTLTSP